KIYYFYQSFFIIAAGFDISWFFMGIEDFRKTVLRNIFVKIASLIAVFIFVKTESDVGKYILVLSISTLMGNLTLWPYLHRFVSRPDFTKLDLWKHFFPSLTLFIPQIATQVYLVLNKTMLGAMEGVKSAGYYENSDKIVKVILAIITATGTVMLPRVANTYAKGNKEKVYQYLVLSFDFVSSICIPMALGLAAIAPKFSIWFLGSDFAITGKIISILSLVIIFIGWSNVLGTQYLLPTNQTRYYTISVISGASINLIMNIPLIQIFGIYGAVISTVLSELTVTTVQLFFIKRTIKLSKLFTGKWKYFLSAALMFIVVRYMHVMLPSGLLFFTIEAFLGILIYFLLLYLLKAPILNLAITIIRKRFH
ncbi:polysaccharide biosynthesis C-terminal domain-containing protein, partial [Enterococcus hirae]|nr:polysaccharide biosynthesis C-terminal domain-containing protein [Enterococcus hirae]